MASKPKPKWHRRAQTADSVLSKSTARESDSRLSMDDGFSEDLMTKTKKDFANREKVTIPKAPKITESKTKRIIPKRETKEEINRREAKQLRDKYSSRSKTTIPSAPSCGVATASSRTRRVSAKSNKDLGSMNEAFGDRDGKTKGSTTASKYTKAARGETETDDQKKEREMAEEVVAYKKRAGKTTKAKAPNLTASKETKAPRAKIETVAQKKDREAAEARDAYKKRAGKTTVATAPKISENTLKREPRKIETVAQKKEREAAAEKALFEKNNGKGLKI